MRGLLLATSVLLSGCAFDRFDLPDGEETTEEDPPAVDDDPGTKAADPKPLFTALEPALVAACEGCHGTLGASTAHFLDGPDRYVSISSYPSVIVDPAEQSLLLVYPVAGSGHPGPTIDSFPDLIEDVRAWLGAEADALREAAAAKPKIRPFFPELGFNSISLEALDPAFEGAALTFFAESMEGQALVLHDLEIHASASVGVSVLHPVFGVVQANGDVAPDPSDSLEGETAYAPPASSAALGAAPVVLTDWQGGLRIAVGFELAQPVESP